MPKDPTNTMSGKETPDGKKASKMAMKVTNMKGKHNQPKGSNDSNTKPRYAKKMSNGGSSMKASMDEMEF